MDDTFLDTWKEDENGFDSLVEAVADGDIPACYQLGYCYAHGIGTKKNPGRAISLFDDYLSSCSEDSSFEAEAHLEMGLCLLTVPENSYYASFSTAFKEFDAAYSIAASGSAVSFQSAYYLGLCYLFGLQTKTDAQYGLSLIEESSCEKFAPALGFMKRKEKEDKHLKQLMKSGTVSLEDQMQEARLRLSLLQEKGFTKEAKIIYEGQRVPAFGWDDTYGVDAFTPEIENYEKIKAIVDSFEARGNHVYYIHYTMGFSGTMVNLFYVSSDSSEWRDDRLRLLSERPIVAVANLNYDFMEIGAIEFDIEKESISRAF